MGIIAKDMEPIPAGMHRAICINVFDVGWQPGYQGGPSAHKVVVLWEIEPRKMDGKHFTVTKIYTLSINSKSNLGCDLESWRGKPFSAEELHGFDLDAIMGKPCQINLVQNGDKVKIATVLPAQRMTASDGKMRLTEHWTPETAPDYLPAFVQKMRDTAIPDPSKKQPATATAEGADGFQDDIPF